MCQGTGRHSLTSWLRRGVCVCLRQCVVRLALCTATCGPALQHNRGDVGSCSVVCCYEFSRTRHTFTSRLFPPSLTDPFLHPLPSFLPPFPHYFLQLSLPLSTLLPFFPPSPTPIYTPSHSSPPFSHLLSSSSCFLSTQTLLWTNFPVQFFKFFFKGCSISHVHLADNKLYLSTHLLYSTTWAHLFSSLPSLTLLTPSSSNPPSPPFALIPAHPPFI